jgi:PKD repeat protein
LSGYGKQIATTAVIGVVIALSVGLAIYYANPAARYSPSSSISTSTNTESVSTTWSTIYTSTNSYSTSSYKTINSATTISFPKASSPLSINYIVITTPNCSTYHFDVNVTDIGYYGSGPPFKYVWDFGDNGTWSVGTSSNSTSHTYLSTGSYTIDLSVFDTPASPSKPNVGDTVYFAVVLPPSGC